MADLANLRISVDSREVKTAVGDLDRLSSASSRSEQSATRLSGAMKLLRNSSIGAAFLMAAKSAMDFEKSMAEVSTLIDTTVVSMNQLTASVRNQAKQFGGDVQTQAAALYQIISAGASDAATANNILTASNKLAVGGVTDVATAADGLTSVLNAFGDKVEGATAVSDAMFIAMRAGKTTIAELSASLGSVAPLAAQMGISFDELVGSAAALTKGGISTSVAMTGLRAILATVAKPSQEAAELAEKLGIEFNSAGLGAKGLAGFMEDLQQKTGGSQEAMAILFGGVEALVPALALTGQAGKDLTAILEQMGVKAGQTDEAVKKMEKTFASQFAKALANAKDVMLTFGQVIQQVLLPLLKVFNSSIDEMVFAATAAAIAFALLKASMAVGSIATYLRSIVALQMALGATGTASALFGAGLKLVQGSLASLTAAMMANPFIAVAAALIAVTTLLYSNRDAQVQVAGQTVRFGDIFLGVFELIRRAVAFVTKVFREGWASAIGSIAPELAWLGGIFDRVFNAIGNFIKNFINEKIGEFVGFYDAVSAIFTGGDITDAFSGAFEKDYIGGFTKQLGNGVVALANLGAEARKTQDDVAGLAGQGSETAAATNAAAGAADKASKKTKEATDALMDYYKALIETGKYLGITNEYEIQAAKAREAGRTGLAALILAQGKSNEARQLEIDNEKKRQDFAKGTLADLQFENSLIGMNNQQREQAIAMRDLETAKVAEGTAVYNAYLAAVAAGSEGKASEEQAKRIQALQQEIELMGMAADAAIKQAAANQALALGYAAGTAAFDKFMDGAAQEAGLQKTVDGLQKIKDAMQEVKDMTFDIDLQGVFGNVGTALGGLVNVYDDFAKRQKVLAVAMSKDNKDEVGRRVAQQKSFRNDINLYGNLAASAKGFFKEKSLGYKVMQAAEAAFRAFEFAMSIKSQAMKLAEAQNTVVAKGTEAAANTTAGASKIFSQLGVYAFPIVAAMIAVMASLGGKGGSVATPSIPSAEDMQKQQGAGSVLGDATAKSDSINRALEIMAANSNSDLEYSNQMLVSLRSIQSSMANLSNNVAKQISVSGGMFDTSKQKLGQTGSGGVLGLFASSTTRELQDLGVDITASTIAEIIAGGISGRTFQVVQQVKKKSGFLGIGGSTKTTLQTTTGDIDASVRDSITGVVASLRQGLIDGAAVIGLDGAAAILDSLQVNIGKISLSGLTGKEIEEQLNAVFSKVGDQMAGALLPSLAQMQRIGEGLFETFARVAREYQVVDVALRSIGKEFGAVGLASIEARSALVGLFESLGEFVEMTSYFRDNFLSEAEKMAPIATAVAEELARLGLSSITTIEQFKMVVLGLDLTTAAGRETYAAMLRLAPAFKKVADAQAEIAAALAKAQADLAAKAAADAKLALEAAEKAAKALRDLADKRASMEIVLLDALGRSAEALAARRANELAAIDDTLRGLQLQIYAAQDAQAASRLASEAQAKAAQEAAAAAEKALALGRERQQLEIQLLEVQGFAVEALTARRVLELAGMDASLRGLKQQIFAAQDKAEADALAATAANEAAQSLQQYADALSNVSKTIVDEINRLRGVTTSTSAVLLKAQFATVTAQARNGNLEALGKLPELSKSIEAATIASASSALEVARIRAWLDASLSETLNTQGMAPTATADGLTFDGNNTASANTQQTSGDLSNMSSALNNALYQVAKNTGKSYELLDRWDGNGLPDIREDASDYY